ncbi:hypothetical protein AB0I34_30005 [Kribbella sp. NPDC050281]|uniref:hypothetical protein n=1 Tax=Kribbella sp. NPDC050281 TaxID=3155515 RepID=UPI00340645B8
MAEQLQATRQGEQWGWEYRGRELVVVDPQELPVPVIPAPLELAKLEDKRAVALRTRAVLSGAAFGGVLLTVGVAFATRPLLALIPGALTLGLGWLRWVRPEVLRRATAREHQRWLATCTDSMARFEADVQVWQDDLNVRERSKAVQNLAVRPWVSVGPTTKERVDLYGGTAAGWRSALLAMGSSLMSAGGRLTVLDLTQDSVAEPLRQMAEAHGAPIRSTVVPDEKRSLNLLAGLDAEEIGVVIGDALRAAESEQVESRGVDATLVQQVAECLTEKSVSMNRLHLAFQVLLRQLPPDQMGDLTRAEYTMLIDLLSEAARRSAEPRLFRLAAGLKRLAGVSGDVAMDGWDGEDISLRTVQVSHRESDLTASLVRHLIFQVAMFRIQRGQMSGRGERIVVIAGADVISRPDLERFDSICRRNGLRLVLLFSHLRDSAVELLGGGDAVLFMRLGNAKEAEQAATFIGRQHRLVASQFTYSHGTNTSQSTSDSTTRGNNSSTSDSVGVQTSDSRQATFGLLFSRRHRSGSKSSGEQYSSSTTGGSSWSESTSTSASTGTTESTSVGYQRTYEYSVEPTVLQGLSPTAFIMVDPRDPASPRLGDCDPRLGDQ